MIAPKRGSVIRYSYLWAGEDARGRREGRKDRPTLAIAVSIVETGDVQRVYVLAITHTPPLRESDGVEIPVQIKRSLKLDDERAWIVTTEVNAFTWPGPDIRPIPGRAPSTAIYGTVPDSLLARAVRSFLANREKKRSSIVSRSG